MMLLPSHPIPALTRFVLRHRLLVVAAWLLLAVAGAATASSTVHRLTTSYALPGAAGDRANQQIIARYGTGGTTAPTVPVITLPAGTTVDMPGVRARLGTVFAAARSAGHVRIADYANTGDRAFVTRDGRSTYALVFTPGDRPDALDATDKAVARAVQQAAPAGWQVHVTGWRQLYNSKPKSQGPGVIAESMIGALGALVVLAFVFASFLAVLPLVIAGVSILTTFLLLRGLTAMTDVSFIAEYLIALIGLGVAIDYSLLVVTRWREERDRGRDNIAAVEVAMANAGRAVLFSGLLVGVGLLALVALPVPFLRSLGYAGLLIPIVSLVAALTLLPILLATVGPRLDWPHRRREAVPGRRWLAWARVVVRRRWLAAAAGIAVLAALIVPLFSIRVGEPSAATLATSGPARTGLSILTAGGVPSGVLTPVEVLTRGDPAPVAAQLARLPGVHDVVAPGWRSGDTALLAVLASAETTQSPGTDVVHAVRDATADDPRVLGVGGMGPPMVDFTDATYGHFWLMLLLVALVTFALLALALRSIVLPLKAILLNFASVAAAYGVLVLVWQDGHGSDAVWGVPGTGAVTFWVPVFVFAFLFGLSMDYEVFILSRVREEHDAGASTDEAVATGLARTGRLVTSAALILMLALLAMSSTPQTDVKILATGMGAGILIDATVVRCLLVPALVSLLGRWNWWLPASLARRRPRHAVPVAEPAPVALSSSSPESAR